MSTWPLLKCHLLYLVIVRRLSVSGCSAVDRDRLRWCQGRMLVSVLRPVLLYTEIQSAVRLPLSVEWRLDLRAHIALVIKHLTTLPRTEVLPQHKVSTSSQLKYTPVLILVFSLYLWLCWVASTTKQYKLNIVIQQPNKTNTHFKNCLHIQTDVSSSHMCITTT